MRSGARQFRSWHRQRLDSPGFGRQEGAHDPFTRYEPPHRRVASLMTIGWKLHPEEREVLLAKFPPAYDNVVADHVTLQSDHGAGTPELPPPAHARIIGCADDGSGCQAMVVEVAGSSARPTGGTYHITWSLGEGRRARESNDVIATHGFAAIDDDTRITLDPRAW
ncbi:hypothetical protein SPAN111604_04990 [Sphingomonas antarctica]|uniref:hypothetical protein n=1 Tax=Sphingomonas antarctica TaxID=2040274 RepID=UPI0039E92532